MSNLGPVGSAFSELVVEVFRLNGLALAAGDVLAAPAGLTSARWQVLGVIDHAPATVASIARTMGLTRQSVRQTTEALVTEGYASSQENPEHQRARLIEITAAGRKALRAVERRHALWAERIGARIGASTLSAALPALRAAREAMEESS
ncbi:MAG TPA: MarR family winged helix-turn-helix transcriptional regulator [Polyangiaceae bacterium]|nr:MarR family winged helix-turn-helix transcriptional regulator [Polyangiaceae bacterium]